MSTFASVQAASIDLSDFEGRRGLGTVRFTGLEFLDREHNSQQKTPSGEPLIMRFHYKAKSSIAPVSFGFRLMTEFGTLVTEVSTSHYDLVMPKLAIGEGFIDLEIESLNLMPGRYYLTLGIASGAGDLQDALDNCARLDVEQANIYGSSQQSDSRHGIMFFAQRWNTGGVRAA
jgi:hypothetical protein